MPVSHTQRSVAEPAACGALQESVAHAGVQDIIKQDQTPTQANTNTVAGGPGGVAGAGGSEYGRNCLKQREITT